MDQDEFDAIVTNVKDKLRKAQRYAEYYRGEIILGTAAAITVGTIAYYRSTYAGKLLLEVSDAAADSLSMGDGVIYSIHGEDFLLVHYPTLLATIRR